MDFLAERETLLCHLNSFEGKTINELSCKFGFFSNAKNFASLLVGRIIDSYKGKPYKKAFFRHEDILCKTISAHQNLTPCESMSFPAFQFSDLVNQDWNSSDFRKVLLSTFLLCVFVENGEEKVFRSAFYWRMPEADREISCRKVWEETKRIISEGNIVNFETPQKVILTFPREANTDICHVRPHGRNSLDLSRLPKNDVITNYAGVAKQSFWLNKLYLQRVLRDNLLW